MKKLYLYSASSICNQQTFNRLGFSKHLIPIESAQELIHPDYKAIIPPVKLRRLSKLSRMAIATSVSALEKSGVKNAAAIITATGMGNLDDTEHFLQKFIPAGDSLVAPVSFIQSGHNTVAGQLALYLGNKGYNTTHVQQHLSFEHALMDAMMHCDENDEPVLLGAFDEKINLFSALATQFGLDKSQINKISEGSTFMVAGSDKEMAIVGITDVEIHIKTNNPEKTILSFLKRNQLSIKQLDRVLIGNTIEKNTFPNLFTNPLVYTDFCGHYYSSSAFGCHLAIDLMATQSYKKTMVVNYMKTGIGLILLEHV